MINIKQYIEEDLSRFKIVSEMMTLIDAHIYRFHKRKPTDKELHGILSQLIKRYEDERG
jgi:hypothetical protein